MHPVYLAAAGLHQFQQSSIYSGHYYSRCCQSLTAVNFVANTSLCCPLDGLQLISTPNSLQCREGHSFDIARQGYVNLLSANDKRTRDPGDSKAMVAARRDFLDAGHYQPVAEQLIEIAVPLIGKAQASRDAGCIVDAGCGEGYYLQQLWESLANRAGCTPACIAYDISKWATQAAARRFPATWLVASNRAIPVADNSADLLLSLFGFPTYDSFARVLKDGGHLLLAGAGPGHLLELREVIYTSVKRSENSPLHQAEAAGFKLQNTTVVQYRTRPLVQEEVRQLLAMTPHLFRASREGKERALKLQDFVVSVDVVFHLLRAPA